MSIDNFPAALRPIIQQGFLEREFQLALKTNAPFLRCATNGHTCVAIGGIDAIEFPNGEMASIPIQHYAAATDLNMVTCRVGIASQFLQNAYMNGEQAAKALNDLAAAAIYRAALGDGGVVVRPSHQPETAALKPVDTLTLAALLDAVARLRSWKAAEIDGVYNCYLDPVSARQLFADPDFKQLYAGVTTIGQVFLRGMTDDFLGLRFIPVAGTHGAPHPTLPGLMVRRSVVCAAGAVFRADFAGSTSDGMAPRDAIVTLIDGVAMVTREPVERLQQIIAQSWYWIGGFGAPVSKAGYRRAVVVEHIG